MNSKLLFSLLLAIIISVSVISIIETNWSIFQFVIGLIVFLLPFMFLSSFKNTLGLFILTVLILLFIYFSLKYYYYGTLLGAINGITIGLFISFFKTSKASVINIKELKKDYIKNR